MKKLKQIFRRYGCLIPFLVFFAPQHSWSIELVTSPEYPSVIMVSGDFERDEDFSDFVSLVVNSNPSSVLFSSPGGNVLSAMKLGRLIRQFRLNTFQPRALECSSACALAFFGGAERQADPGAIGVHRASFSGDITIGSEDAVSVVQELTAETIQYLLEMDIDPAILQLSLRYDASDIRYLSLSEMKQFGVVSDVEYTASFPSSNSDESSNNQPKLSIENSSLGGVIRHPKGGAHLMQKPRSKNFDVRFFPNKTPIQILRIDGSWYNVRIGSSVGWMERSWVKISGTYGGYSEQRYIQIKSFEDEYSATEYARSFSPNLWAFSTLTDWYAVTIPRKFSKNDALKLRNELVAGKKIPNDSLVLYGNTYLERVCCQK